MQCRYCRAWNSDEEHRCTRCGRRLWAVSSQSTSEPQPIQTATAPQYYEYAAVEEAVTAEAPPPAARPAYQRTLFREMQTVVEMPSRVEDPPRPVRTHRHKPRRVHEDQQSLDFNTPRVESAIYCNEPVASPVHRVMASVLDMSMIVVATALFAFTFWYGTGNITVTARSTGALSVIGLVIGVFYHVLFAMLGEGRTPGMAWVQLDMLAFDGRRPTREQRIRRLFAGLLSTAAAGLGLLWAIVDEEQLTWHDHISRTFVTPGQ